MFYSYAEAYKHVNSLGEVVEVRGLRTKELLGGSLEIPSRVLVKRPGLNRALGYMELCQLVGGTFDADALKRVAPKANHALFTEQMAYGPRALLDELNQFEEVHAELMVDPHSRRATVVLAHGLDGPADKPCTQYLQFTIRRGVLDCQVSMRSWDLWWGAPYDLIMFGGVTQLMASTLGVLPGQVRVTAGSMHLYEAHWGKQVPYESEFFTFVYQPLTWSELEAWALKRVINKEWLTGPPDGIMEMGATEWLAYRGS